MQQRKKPTHGKTTASVPASAPPAPHSVSLLDPSILNSFFPIFFFLLVPRFLAANRAPISDCDETFNFWEAVHHLTFSGGQQTWEHAPQFALRSWLYDAPCLSALTKCNTSQVRRRPCCAVSHCRSFHSVDVFPGQLLVHESFCAGGHIRSGRGVRRSCFSQAVRQDEPH